ncbi:hypothetical protein [Clostridium butyricum]|uniref:hypothetical protein n=1 Tax=Clostridium butyricum TaxID=1492 RepID=UPI002AB0FF49|nr:hypothetical protein [Clostridium butyricum]
MILRNRYKDEMSKIHVDDDMKKRVMNRIRETDEVETKVNKKSLFQGQAFFKYSGVVAACCAFAVTYAVTYAVTINYPELVNHDESSQTESEHTLNSEENQSSSEKNNDVPLVKEDSNNISDSTKENSVKENSTKTENKESDNKTQDKNKTYENNNEKSLDIKNNEVAPEKENRSDSNTNKKEVSDKANESNNNVSKKEDEPNSINNNQAVSSSELQSSNDNVNNNEIHDPNKTKAASYGMSIQNEYLSQYNGPNLSDIGYNVDYINQIDENQIEIKYSNNQDDLWIRIYNKEESNSDKSSGYEKQKISSDNYGDGKEEGIIYRKNNREYYIWSSKKLDENFISNITKHIL